MGFIFLENTETGKLSAPYWWCRPYSLIPNMSSLFTPISVFIESFWNDSHLRVSNMVIIITKYVI